jgi:choice-of-anchor C domain-containing protein
MMKSKLIRLATTLAFFGFVTPASAVSLITNGSFEDGTTYPGEIGLNGGSTAITGWTVIGGFQAIDWVGIGWQAQDGNRSLDLNGRSVGGIEQLIPTVGGQQYNLTFYLSGNYAFPDTKTLTVSAGATSGNYSYTVTLANSPDSMLWQQEWLVFPATGSSTLIRFASTTNNCCYGPALDNVSVNATPLPAALPLFATGLGALGLLGWRRKRKAKAIAA